VDGGAKLKESSWWLWELIMRARNIKPNFFKSDQLLECEPLARLLFAGLWCLADRRGRLEDRPNKIRIEILPCDNTDVNALLDQLKKHGLIERYEVDGERFIHVINFNKHQNPHKDEKDSVLPPPPCRHDASTVQTPCEHSANTVLAPYNNGANPADILIPDLLIPEIDTEPAQPKCPKTSRLLHHDIPREWAQWTSEQFGWAPEVIQDVWLNFRDYWQGRSGRGAQKSEWDATWRNWCRQQKIQNIGKNYGANFNNTMQNTRGSKSERAKAALIESASQLGYAADER
jgi:hypothetical protein